MQGDTDTGRNRDLLSVTNHSQDHRSKEVVLPAINKTPVRRT